MHMAVWQLVASPEPFLNRAVSRYMHSYVCTVSPLVHENLHIAGVRPALVTATLMTSAAGIWSFVKRKLI